MMFLWQGFMTSSDKKFEHRYFSIYKENIESHSILVEQLVNFMESKDYLVTHALTSNEIRSKELKYDGAMYRIIVFQPKGAESTSQKVNSEFVEYFLFDSGDVHIRLYFYSDDALTVWIRALISFFEKSDISYSLLKNL